MATNLTKLTDYYTANGRIPKERPEYVSPLKWSRVQRLIKGKTIAEIATEDGVGYATAYESLRSGIFAMVGLGPNGKSFGRKWPADPK